MSMLRNCTLAVCIAAAVATSGRAETKGSLVIGGGAIDSTMGRSGRRLWSWPADAVPKIAIFPTASGNPHLVGDRIIETFKKACRGLPGAGGDEEYRS